MSKIQVKAFFKFCRVKVMEQVVDIVKKVVTISVKPVEHFPRISGLKKLGFRIILFPGDLLFSAAKKMKEVLALMKERGDPEYWKEDMMSVNEFRNLLDMDRYEELEGRYLPAIMPNNLVVSL